MTKLIKKKQQGGSIIGKVLQYNPATALPIAVGKKIASNLAENLDPWSYSNVGRRFVTAGLLGKQESNARMSLANKGVYGEAFKERSDLLRMLMNQPQKYNSILESKYRPTVSTDNRKYYSSAVAEKELSENITRNPETYKEFSKHNLPGGSLALGNYTIDKGQDNNGPYVSYYDKWDINPIPATGKKWIDKTVDNIVTGIPEALGITTTPEIYGRIYLDPKTGKPK